MTWQRDPLGRWTQTLYDALNRPYETIKNYENGDPTTVAPADQSWTDGSDTDLISYTGYNPEATVARSIANYVNGSFSATAPITDTITLYQYDPLGRQTATILNDDPSQHTRTDTNRTTSYQYDPTTGLQVGEQDPLWRWATTQYDALGRASTVTQNCTDSGGTPVATGCAAFDGANHPDRNVPSTTQYDALGHVTRTDFDGVGRAIDVIQHYVSGGTVNSDTNVKTQTAYDGLGETLSSTDAKGNASAYTYDGLGDKISSTDPLSRTSQMGYDGTGTLRWAATPDGRVTVYQVDGLGRVTTTIANYQTGSSTAPDQDLATAAVYDAGGRQVQSIDPAGHVTSNTYDLLDRQTSVTKNAQSGSCSGPPCNVTTLYKYDRVGKRIAIVDPNGHTRSFSYDAADEQTQATDALNRSTGYTYDLGERLTGTVDPRGSPDNLAYSYDGLDRLTQTSALNLPAPITASYDALGERLTLGDGSGSTNIQYDNLGRITQVQAPTTGTVGYTYDANGQRTGLTYPDSTALGYQYWPDGQLQAVTQGATTLASYSYDGAGRLAGATRANGTSTTYSYDGADRLSSLSTTLGSQTLSAYSYQRDRLGQTTAVTETVAPAAAGCDPVSSIRNNAGISHDSNPGAAGFDGSNSYSYEALQAAGVTPGSVVSSNGLAFSWPNVQPGTVDNASLQGQTVALGAPAGASTLGFLGASINGDQSGTGTLTYTDGMTATFTLALTDWFNAPMAGDTVAITTTYRNTPTGQDARPFYVFSTSVPLDRTRTLRSVTLPSNGNMHLFALAIPAPAATRTVSYSYDGIQELTGASESPGSSFAYTYDPAGNRTSVTVNGTTASYSYDAANQVVGWTYDAAGNLTNDGTTTYSYDALSRLTGTTATGQTRAYSYNGDGTLVAATANGTTATYAQDLASDLSQILAVTSSCSTTGYLYELDRLATLTGGARTWYGVDGQGSVRQMLGDNGAVTGMQNYDPYGQVESCRTAPPTSWGAGTSRCWGAEGDGAACGCS